jgi:protein-S-isoprenylcysteine O-methyltransferase Ste14
MSSVWPRTALGFGCLMAVMALALFLPAGTANWSQAWLYWAIFFACSLSITAYFLRVDPSFIVRRLGAGPVAEPTTTQKVIQSAASLCFLAILVVPGLDKRFGWSGVPLPLSLVADALVAGAFWVVFRVFDENRYASSIVTAEADQRVTSSGPSRIVRHPMYSAGVVLVVFTALALGSWWGLIPAVLLAMVIVVRLLDEERFLLVELPGYADYCTEVRHRLIPAVW